MPVYVPRHTRNGRPVRAYSRRNGTRRGPVLVAAAAALAVLGGGVLIGQPAKFWPRAGGGARPVPATVRAVVDGDTLDVATDGGSRRSRVRVLGVDTPELAHDGEPAECYAKQAKSRTSALLRGGPVHLVVDPTQPATDRYDRRLAYVEVDGTDLGAQLISGGYARAYHPRDQTPPQRARAYADLEQEARRHYRGQWGRCRR